MSKPLEAIVIGTSLTEASDSVVRTGVAIARATGASPWLIHAYLPLTLPPEAGLDARWIEVEEKNLREGLIAQARRTGLFELQGFFPEQILLVIGPPHREIVDLARRVEAGLVVVGAAESRHGLLGSTADRVIRKAACPVFAVRSEATFPPTEVEIPVDLSPLSALTLSQGLDFLEQLGVPPAETEVLFVLNPFEMGGSIQFTPEQVERFAAEELQRFVQTVSSERVRPRLTRVRTGYAQEEILATLAERQVDLAVLGTHGRSGFERLMLGSVALGVLKGATCNLLIVPPGASRLQDTATQPSEVLAGADWEYVSDESPVTAGRF
ncbi:MAG TPA: universal stress protein [Thermoanaerobaculia bacterium]|nr:universal stress protein [Thermoanaerobaculia bacterium]